jgi:hypothetical protein
MPVSSVTLSAGYGRESARRPVLCRPPGNSTLARQGTQIALIRGRLRQAACGFIAVGRASGEGQCYRQGLVHAAHGGR